MALRGLFCAALLLLWAASPARAGKFDDPDQESLIPGVKLGGLLDARYYYTGRSISWLNGGPNTLRYGGIDTDNSGLGEKMANGVSLPQASLLIDAEVHPNAKIHIQANASTDASSGTSKVGIVEAYAKVDKDFEHDSFHLRAGDFIPVISWEHPDPAWSTRYTLTPSVIGSWVGEEIRTLGAEGLWQHDLFEGSKSRLTAGASSGNDQVGRLLWFRGWSLDDYQGMIGQRYTVQTRSYDPSVGLDGRLGYYGRGDLLFFDHAVQVGGGYWTNNGNDTIGLPGANNLNTEDFRTRLFHYGGKIEYQNFTVIGQFLRATINSQEFSARDWNAGYVLGSAEFGKLRVSERYDRFWVLNFDNSFASTSFVAWNFSVHQQLGVEFIYKSARPIQTEPISTKASEIDRLTQVNYRLRF